LVVGTSYLRRRTVILSAVKARVRKKNHKYGIEVPTSFVRAKELDRLNGNTLWMDALKLEMHNVGVAFEVLENGKSASQGSTNYVLWASGMLTCKRIRITLSGT
jgi:hypothetical protein